MAQQSSSLDALSSTELALHEKFKAAIRTRRQKSSPIPSLFKLATSTIKNNLLFFHNTFDKFTRLPPSIQQYLYQEIKWQNSALQPPDIARLFLLEKLSTFILRGSENTELNEQVIVALENTSKGHLEEIEIYWSTAYLDLECAKEQLTRLFFSQPNLCELNVFQHDTILTLLPVYATDLIKLKLRSCHEISEAGLESLKLLKKLKELYISDIDVIPCFINTDHFVILFENLPNLKCIDANHRIDFTSIFEKFRARHKGKTINIEKINLVVWSGNLAHFQTLLNLVPNLKELELIIETEFNMLLPSVQNIPNLKVKLFHSDHFKTQNFNLVVYYGKNLTKLCITHEYDTDAVLDVSEIGKYCPHIKKLHVTNFSYKNEYSFGNYFSELQTFKLELTSNGNCNDYELSKVLFHILTRPSLQVFEFKNSNELPEVLTSVFNESRLNDQVFCDLKKVVLLHVLSEVNIEIVIELACIAPKLENVVLNVRNGYLRKTIDNFFKIHNINTNIISW